MQSEVVLQPAQPLNDLEYDIDVLYFSSAGFVQVLGYLEGDNLIGETHEGEEVFLNQQVGIGLEVAKSDWIFEFFVLYCLVVGIMLALYVLVDIECNAGQLPPDNRLQIQLYPLLEVIQPVDQSPDISLQRPASPCLLNQPYKVIKRISLDQFANVDRVTIIDQRRHDLEETAQIGQFGTHYHLLTACIVVLVLLN